MFVILPLVPALPGAGGVYASRLLAVMGAQRVRWSTAQELACLSGIAPVMERSGQSTWIRWRYFCAKLMRQSFHECAGELVKHSFWARAIGLRLVPANGCAATLRLSTA